MALSRNDLSSSRLDLDRFVDQLDNKYKCPICHELLRSPTQCPQGHVFCRECINIVANQPDCRCPMDRISFCKSQLHPNLFVQNCINDLSIKCKHSSIPDSDEQCSWSGPLHSLEKHETVDCLFRTIPCPNVDCPVLLQSRHLNDHQQSCPNRMSACQHCNSSVQYCQLIAHVEVCDLAPVPCPNGCGDALVVRRDHLPVCPLELVECPLYRINCCHNTHTSVVNDESSSLICNGSLRRRDLLSHMSNPATLAETLVALCGKVQSLTDKQNSADRELDSLRRSVIPSQWGLSSSGTTSGSSRYEGPRLPPFNSMQLGAPSPRASIQQNRTTSSIGPARRTSLPVDPTEDEWLMEDWEASPVQAPPLPSDALSRVLTARRQGDYLPRSRYSSGDGAYRMPPSSVPSLDLRGASNNASSGGGPQSSYSTLLSGPRGRSHPVPPFRPPTPPPLPGISSGAQRLSTTAILSDSRRRGRDWDDQDGDEPHQQQRNVRARTARDSADDTIFAPALSAASRHIRNSLGISALPPSTSRRSVDLNPQQRSAIDVQRSVGSETDSLGVPSSQRTAVTGLVSSAARHSSLSQSTRGRVSASEFSDSLMERITGEQSGTDHDAQDFRRELVDLASSSSSAPRGPSTGSNRQVAGVNHNTTSSTSDALSSSSALLEVVNALETVDPSWRFEQQQQQREEDLDGEDDDYDDMTGSGFAQ